MRKAWVMERGRICCPNVQVIESVQCPWINQLCTVYNKMHESFVFYQVNHQEMTGIQETYCANPSVFYLFLIAFLSFMVSCPSLLKQTCPLTSQVCVFIPCVLQWWDMQKILQMVRAIAAAFQIAASWGKLIRWNWRINILLAVSLVTCKTYS